MTVAPEFAQADTGKGEDKVSKRTGKEADQTAYRTQRVQTGDASQPPLYGAIALGSGFVLLGLGVMALKKKKNREEGELRS